MKSISSVVTLLAAAAISVGGLKADNLVTYSSRAGFGGNDTLDWGQLGACNQNVAATFNATSAGGLNLTGSLASDHVRENKQRDISGNSGCPYDGWYGNFAAGDNLVWTGITGAAPVTLNFASSISGVGFQIQSDHSGNFTAQIDAYNGATLLGSFSGNGVSAYTADNSAIFLGLRDLSGSNITSLVISLTSAPGNSITDFAFNQLSLDDHVGALTPAPEPSMVGIALVLFLGMVAFAHRWKTMLQRCE
jgi:hypothetical protein